MIRWRLSKSSRLIDALKEQEPSRSARFLKRTVEANGCRVNGRVERFASVQLKKGDWIELLATEEQDAPIRILYEDETLLAIDKPAGLVCTDAACRQALGRAVSLAHRLDKDTTGVLLFAKRDRESVQALFEKREMEKEYLALVDGVPMKDGGTIRNYLAPKRQLAGQTVWGSAPQGLLAETSWEVVERFAHAALVRCRPKTGRTHQIRVHLAEMGHPILVDRQYATQFRCRLFVKRPLLHAARLSFEWTGDRVIEAPLPADLADAIARLRQ